MTQKAIYLHNAETAAVLWILVMTIFFPMIRKFHTEFYRNCVKKLNHRGAWVAHSVKHLTVAQVMILRLASSSPALGSELSSQLCGQLRAWSLLQILCLPLSLPLPPLTLHLSLSLSLKNKHLKKLKKKKLNHKIQ